MWKSFVLELHGEWSEFIDECIALKSSTEKEAPLIPVDDHVTESRNHGIGA